MSPLNNPQPKGKVAQLWHYLFGLSIWLGSTVGQFLVFNIVTDFNSNYSDVVVGLGTLVSAAVIGLALLAPKISRTAATARFWYKSAVAALLLLILLMFLYIQLSDSWTCPYQNYPFRFVMGDHESTELKDYFLEHSVDRCEALEDFIGNTGIMYSDSITKFLTLASVYILAWSVLSFLIISLSNAYQVSHARLPTQ